MAAGASSPPWLMPLAETLSLVPLAVVPSLVDCFLASSSVSPLQLFSHTLQVFEGALEDDGLKLEESSPRRLISFMAAMIHLMRKSDVLNETLEMFIQRGLLPLLCSTAADDRELLDLLEYWLSAELTNNQHLNRLKSSLLPLCLHSICHSSEISCPNELSICQWNRIDHIKFSLLSLTVTSRILSSFISFSCKELALSEKISAVDLELDSGSTTSETLALELIWDLSLVTSEILMQYSERRSEVIRLLFPAVLEIVYLLPSFKVIVSGELHTFSRADFIRKFCQRCVAMLSLGKQESKDGYILISLHLSVLNAEGHGNYTTDEKYGIIEDDEFWGEIRRSLVDKDASVRKNSLYILKKILKHGNPPSTHVQLVQETAFEDKTQGQGISRRGKWADKEAKSMGVGKIFGSNVNEVDKWSVFFLLYEMLEEYGTHLVEAAWTHQMSLFFQSGTSESVTCLENHCHNQMQTRGQMFKWLAILWERGFFHENPQVRCLIMNSFLCMDWKSERRYAKFVPKSFILGPFILGLNDPIHHKDFGLKSYYNSVTIQGAKEFIREYTVDLYESERIDFVFSLANITREESFGRAGLVAFTSCLASAATGLEKLHPQGFIDAKSSELLNSFGVIVERTKQHFNLKYRLQVCELVMDATLSMVSVDGMPREILLQFISAFPREFTDFGGTQRNKVQEWLHFNSGILRQLVGFTEDFVKCDVDNKGFDDEDMDAWIAEAQRWARLLFLMVKGEKDLEPVFQFIRDSGCSISCDEKPPRLYVPKFLVLVICLVDEEQIALKKWKLYSKSRSSVESSMAVFPNQFPTIEAILSLKQLKSTLLLILDELTRYCASACSIFWSDPTRKGVDLPSFKNGKLGGPSLRRLPLHLTIPVLHAILSVRAVASILSFIAQLGEDLGLNSSFLSLWTFCCKVIRFESDVSEISSEIHLAAYEAVAYVLTALSPICFSSFHEVIRESNLHALGAEVEKFLDPFLYHFRSNISNLIAKNTLTRSRRAVLMRWKWLCLDSLLSLPYRESGRGVHPSMAVSFYSSSILRNTVSDIVESLVNAGEAYVLPLLRCFRSIIGILHKNKCSFVTPGDGFDAEMMMDLVQSSWILHQSCNKRRIAPISALLSSVLHPLLFGDHSLHLTSSGDPGPFKWFIEKILDEGTKSPRTLRLAAMHLTGLWFSHPSTIKYYLKELALLSLHGSVAFDEDFAAELSENHEAVFEVSMLSKLPDSELSEVFINTETYARVSVAVMFEKLGHLGLKFGNIVDNDDALSSHNAGKMFLLDLLDSAVNDKDLAKELYKKHSAIHRRKVRAWQMLCILSCFTDQDIVDEVSTRMHICLHRNNMPSVRQYLEIFAIQIYLKFPFMVEQLLLVFHDYEIKPQALSSYVFVAANVILHTSEVSLQLKHLNTLVPPIIPLLTSHHHSLRGFSQLLVYIVLTKLAPILEKDTCVTTIEKKCFEELRSYLTHNLDCIRLRSSMGGIFDSFDPRTACSASGVFDARNEGTQFECAPVTLMEQVNEFLDSAREELRNSMAKNSMVLKNETDSDIPFPQLSEDSQKLFQRKITPDGISLGFEGKEFSVLADASKFLSELEKEDQLFCSTVQSRNHEMKRLRGREQTIIIVASLIDRIPNLAGLARTCEVFRAAGLAVADSSVVHDKQFQLISVTADKWVPIMEVPVSDLIPFFNKKKLQGFSILGLEQTTNSISIDQFSFPKKTVLVLGREKEGIPVEIIHYLDACLEIPQLGVVRSLNVHVSGAIAIWEYTRQHRASSS